MPTCDKQGINHHPRRKEYHRIGLCQSARIVPRFEELTADKLGKVPCQCKPFHSETARCCESKKLRTFSAFFSLPESLLSLEVEAGLVREVTFGTMKEQMLIIEDSKGRDILERAAILVKTSTALQQTAKTCKNAVRTLFPGAVLHVKNRSVAVRKQ